MVLVPILHRNSLPEQYNVSPLLIVVITPKNNEAPGGIVYDFVPEPVIVISSIKKLDTMCKVSRPKSS